MKTPCGFAILCGLLLLGGCAGAATGRVAGESRDRIMLGQNDSRTQAGGNLFDLIQRERPQWLDLRGPRSLGGTRSEGAVVVYVDGLRLGLPETLREIRVETVAVVQFLSGPEATTRFGLDHQYGAILVETRRTESRLR